ncbi:hypothetical protein [Emticicia sp. 17c]|uniref:hypothetical protein n=1 Tax=Emticicia sp. 17c TaxID=3127704 RepID=UPI00301E48D3
MLKTLVRLLLLITVVSSTQVMGHEGDKPKNAANTSGNAAEKNETKNVGPTSQAEALRMQKAMNKALSSLNLDFANVMPEVITQPLVADETSEARERAMTTFEKVKYMSELSVLNTVLPIGIKETIW